MAKIGIDIRCLEDKEISGVGEYTLELLQNLLPADKKNTYILFSNSFKTASRNTDIFRKYPNVQIKRFHFPNKIFNFLVWYLGYPQIDKLVGGADVFFSTNINFFAFSKNCPLVVTIHDLSFERFEEFFSFKTLIWHKYFISPRKIAMSAKKIIAVSNSTKSDLESIYRIPDNKLEIIPHGVGKQYKSIIEDKKISDAVRKKYNLPDEFILSLGNIEVRKNIFCVLKAYQKIREENPKFGCYKLVFAGTENFSRERMLNLVGRNFQNDVIFTGYVRREDKPLIYNLASLFVYPSHFEGFGLPILEAMACGTPVITTCNSSLTEVAGNSAVYVSAHKPQELKKAVESILSDKKLRETLRQRGLARAKMFSWQECAKKTAQVILNSIEYHAHRH